MPRHGIPEGRLEPVAAFGRVAPLVLDLGAGHGAAAVAYAAAHPHHDVLAVDVHTPGIARMLAAAEERGVRNLRAHVGDAVTLLEQRVPRRSVAAVHLFFPDPWPKARHAKRRFIGPHTMNLIAECLADGGHLRVATDHASYADHAHTELSEHASFAVRAASRPAWRPTDGFEAKGIAAGRTVSDLVAEVRR
jgi:tRNA (guanine-N7-)-methyltransferase